MSNLTTMKKEEYQKKLTKLHQEIISLRQSCYDLRVQKERLIDQKRELVKKLELPAEKKSQKHPNIFLIVFITSVATAILVYCFLFFLGALK